MRRDAKLQETIRRRDVRAKRPKPHVDEGHAQDAPAPDAQQHGQDALVPEADELVAGDTRDSHPCVDPGNQEESEDSDGEMEDAVATLAISEPDRKRQRIQLIEASLCNIQEQLLKTAGGACKI